MLETTPLWKRFLYDARRNRGHRPNPAIDARYGAEKRMGGLIFIINNRRNAKIRKKDKENNLDFNRYFIMKKIVLYILLMLGSSPFLKGETALCLKMNSKTVFFLFSRISSPVMRRNYGFISTKPYYAAGDTIRFRAYLSDAMTLCPDTLSNFIYVDLFDRRNKLISSKRSNAIPSDSPTICIYPTRCPPGNIPCKPTPVGCLISIRPVSFRKTS